MNLPPNLKIEPSTIVLVTGPSGSGKTQSLPLLLSQLNSRVELATEPTFDRGRPIIDVFGPDSKGIRAISAVGLADASSMARTYDELSVGQQARAELGVALLDEDQHVVIDEWLACLDRPTAKAVAWSTQRALRRFGKGAIFITAQDDLADHLQPDVHLQVNWTDEPTIELAGSVDPRSSMLDELTIGRGVNTDWLQLKPLHYAAGNPATVHSIWRASHPGIVGPAGVIVVSYPDLHSAARNLATDSRYQNVKDRRVATVLNREVAKVSRIVVCPQLRGIGIAHEMLNHIVPRLGVRYVECVTSMSRWSGFLERVGFREVPQTSHPVEAELMDWATRERPPAPAYLDGQKLLEWIDALTVRKRRNARRLVWNYYFHFVLHRRTKGQRPKNVPNPSEPGWIDAADLVARRLIERPAYWIAGPIDPMTGLPTDAPAEAVEAA